MVFKLRNGGEFMKKRVIFIVGGILIFIGIVLLGFFLYEEKLKEVEEKIKFNTNAEIENSKRKFEESKNKEINEIISNIINMQ